MMWENYGMGGWAWGLGALVVIGAVIIIIVLAQVLHKPRSAPQQTSNGALTPKQVLDHRYATGELTTEEYRERLSALGLGS